MHCPTHVGKIASNAKEGDCTIDTMSKSHTDPPHTGPSQEWAGEGPNKKKYSIYIYIYTPPGTNMEVENTLLVEENGLPKGHCPLPC